MSDFKPRQEFSNQSISDQGENKTELESPDLTHTLNASPELTAQKQFDQGATLIVPPKQESIEQEQEMSLEQAIRPKRKRTWLAGVGLATFTGLLGWQAVDSVITYVQAQDWLALGWVGFLAALASLGLASIAKELWRLRRLRGHFDTQEQAQALLDGESIGQGKAFCEQVAKQAGVNDMVASYDRWLNQVQPAHSDAEILDMYDAMVVKEQDALATKLISKHATESAVMVAVSPLATADMLLVAWRNFKMIDGLAKVYGIELGYASRLSLFKTVLVNMAFAGASELAIDASMDMLSMDIAGKMSSRASQGFGVGIMTARLGIKTMTLMRPLPWHSERKVKLSSVRKQIVAKLAAIGSK